MVTSPNPSPQPIFAITFVELQRNVEQVPQVAGSKNARFGSVRNDAPVLHQDDTVDLTDDVFDVMGDENERAPSLGKPPHGLAQVPGRCGVEARAGLIEYDHLGVVDEGACDERFSRLTRRQRPHVSAGELLDSQFGDCGQSGISIGLSDALHEVRRDAECAETAAQNHVVNREVHVDDLLPDGRDHANEVAYICECDAVPPEKSNRIGIGPKRYDIAREKTDEGRLSGSVGAENGQTLALGKRKIVDP